MKRLIVMLNARYTHSGPAPWMLREACVRRGLDIQVYEAEVNLARGHLLGDILREGADVVAFCCYIWNIEMVRALTAALRRARPHCVIVWGGPEVGYDAAMRMREAVAPDVILAGEGEQSLPRLLLQLQKGEAPQGAGIVTREADGGVAPPVPIQAWVDLYPPGAKAQPHRLHYVETTRGCPYGCRYCLSSVQGGVRALPAQEAIARLLRARDAGVSTVKVLDRTFNFDAERARAIWAALIKRGAGAIYHFEIAAHLLGEEDIALLCSAPAGLFQMEIGVQSVTEKVLRGVGRHQDFDRLARNVRALRAADNIHLHLDLIAGLPGESYATFASAVDEVLALEPHKLQLGFLKLLPGSPLRADFDREMWPYDPSPPYEVIAHNAMDAQELDRLRSIEVVLDVYGSGAFPRTAQRFLRCFAQIEKAAHSLREEGFFARPQGVEARYDALRRALGAVAEPSLRHDWLAMGRREYRPWMRPAPDAPALRALGLTGREMRRSHVERIQGECVLFGPDGSKILS